MSAEPFGYEQTQQGASCSFMDSVARAVGLAVKTNVRPLARILKGLQNGSVDLTMAVPSPERLEYAISICEPTRVGLSVAFLKGADLSSIAHKKVGVLHNSTLLDRLFDDGAQRVGLRNQEQGFMMLVAGRLDGTFCGKPGCDAAIRKAGLDREALAFMPIQDFPFGLLLSKHSPLAQDPKLIASLHDACLADQAIAQLNALIGKY